MSSDLGAACANAAAAGTVKAISSIKVRGMDIPPVCSLARDSTAFGRMAGNRPYSSAD
jgi:hypothetical protein